MVDRPGDACPPVLLWLRSATVSGLQATLRVAKGAPAVGNLYGNML